jgi:hypothetical protein
MRGPAVALSLLLAILLSAVAFGDLRSLVASHLYVLGSHLQSTPLLRQPLLPWAGGIDPRGAVAAVEGKMGTMTFLLFALALVAMLFGLHQIRRQRRERRASQLRALMAVVEKPAGLEPGEAYIVTQGTGRALKVFADELRSGVRGLCISRIHPSKLKQSEELKTATFIWLTHDSPNDSLSLQDLSVRVSKFVYTKAKGVVLLDGLEYLILQNDFPKVMKFLQNIRDMLAAKGAKLLVPVDLHALVESHRAMLMREFRQL